MAELPEFTALRIGQCRFDPRSHEIEREGSTTRLPRKQSLLLWELARAAPAVVTRQTLIDTVWDRRMVEEAVLSRAIADLRRALGDDSREPRYIETIPKSGYRLRATVSVDEATAAPNPVQPVDMDRPPASPSIPVSRALATRGLLMLTIAIAAILLVWFGRLFWRPPASSTVANPELLGVAELARIRPLTSDPGYEFRPDLSRDGRWLVYAERALDDAHSRLWLQDIDGRHREQLTPPEISETRPALSPDGRQIAFLRVVEGNCELHLRAAVAGSSRRLAACGLPASTPAWSANQRELVFTLPAESGFAAGLGMIDLVDDKITTITRPELALGPDRDPEWVPGQRAITFARGYDGEQHLMRFDLDLPSAEARVLFDAGRLQGHAWHVSGQRMLVASDAPGYRTLVLLDAQGKLVSALNTRGAQYPAWAANGELVFEQAQYDANIYRLELRDPAANASAVIASTRYDASPILSPDGRELAFVSTRDDFEHVYLANADGSATGRVGFTDGTRWSRPSFSPDARFIVATGYDQDNVDWIYRYDRTRQVSERLPELGAHASGARYRKDGNGLVYMRRDARGERSLWFYDLVSAPAPMPIADSEGVEHFEWAGDDLLLRRRNLPGFTLIRGPAFSAKTQVLIELEPITATAWTVRDRQLFIVLRVTGSNVLTRIDIDSGAKDTLAKNIDADAVGPALAISADQSTVWFAHTASLQIDLMRLPASVDAGAAR